MHDIRDELRGKGWPCKLISKHANKALSVSQDPETHGVLIIAEEAERPEQRFRLLRKDDKYIMAAETTLDCVSVLGGSEHNGAPAVTLPFCDVESQYFSMVKPLKNDESCSLLTFCGKALECFGEESGVGTRVVQWANSDQHHQKWYVNFL